MFWQCVGPGRTRRCPSEGRVGGGGRWRYASRRLAAAALTLALHGALLGCLAMLPVARRAPPQPRGVARAIILTVRLPRLRSHHPHAPAVTGAHAGPEPANSIPVRVEPAPARTRAVGSVRPAVRWLGALRRAARRITSRGVPPRVTFGFPRAQAFAPARRAPAWHGWDAGATHRIEELPQGGTLIVLGDRCSLVIAPLPIVGCWLGRLAASGRLFSHMRARATGSLP